MIRAAFAVVFLWTWTAACFAQAEADERAQEAWVASTWSGEIRGYRVSMYLLDEGLVILKAGDEKPREGRWAIRDGKFQTQAKLAERVIVSLDADIRGDVMAGKADAAPFELRRDRKGNPELLAASPPNRPYPPTPRTDPREFDGIYEMDLPELIGQATPLVKNTLACSGGKCVYFVGKEKLATWDKLSVIRPHSFAGARYALKYAMEHKAEAKQEAPPLAPLLDSGATVLACIDLGQGKRDEPGGVILCKTDREPWKTPSVLLMGLILSDTCRAFCGYSIIPLLRR